MLLSWTEEMFLWQGWWLFSKFDVTNFWKCLMRMTLTPTELKTERWGGQSRNWSFGTQWVDESKCLSFHLEGAWRRQQAVDHRASFFSFQSLPLLLISSQHVLFHLCERQVWQPKPGWTLNRFHQGNVHCWLLPFTGSSTQTVGSWPVTTRPPFWDLHGLTPLLLQGKLAFQLAPCTAAPISANFSSIFSPNHPAQGISRSCSLNLDAPSPFQP